MVDFDLKAKEELSVIDSLLRDKTFTYKAAGALQAAYNVGIGDQLPVTAKDENEKVEISELDEMIATNLASFYAIECGINFILSGSKTKNQFPKTVTGILTDLLERRLGSSESLILDRFANATWKAGQPFVSIDRIEQPFFVVANFLPPQQNQKNSLQLSQAAVKLLAKMLSVASSSNEAQMDRLRALLQDTAFAFEFASFVDPTLENGKSKKYSATKMLSKNLRDQKTATSIAGFYALDCGINYLVTTQRKLPSDIVQSLAGNTADEATLNIFARFANATWKAGQPFRSLSGITRRTFTPFNLLTKEDVDKDLNQVRAAAEILVAHLLK